MAKLIVTEHMGRISPVFDVATTVQVVEFEGGRETIRTRLPLRSTDAFLRTKEIYATGASVLICGAISRPTEDALLSAGLQVFSFLCGQVDEIVAAFLRGELDEGSFAMPGCCGRRRERQGAGDGLRNRRRAGHGAGSGCGRGRRRGASASARVLAAKNEIVSALTCVRCGYKKEYALLEPKQQENCPRCGAVMIDAQQDQK